jgi:ABC-type antimicrobial peptide transport system permease subunit
VLLPTIFGAIALVLAAVGIYAIMAYPVEQRNQEMGMRMALGADRSAIQKLVVGQGIRLAIVGVIVGLCAAAALAHVIQRFLFGVKPWDATAFISTHTVRRGLLAPWLPAQRASKLDPIQALRAE